MLNKIGKKRKITWGTRIGFGMGGILGSGALTFTHTYMVMFLTTQVGLAPAEAALIAAFAIYVDAVLAPLMGFISDNFYSTKIGRKFGRRRFLGLARNSFDDCRATHLHHYPIWLPVLFCDVPAV